MVRIIIAEGKPRISYIAPSSNQIPCIRIGSFIHHLGIHLGALDMNKTYQISIEEIKEE